MHAPWLFVARLHMLQASSGQLSVCRCMHATCTVHAPTCMFRPGKYMLGWLVVWSSDLCWVGIPRRSEWVAITCVLGKLAYFQPQPVAPIAFHWSTCAHPHGTMGSKVTNYIQWHHALFMFCCEASSGSLLYYIAWLFLVIVHGICIVYICMYNNICMYMWYVHVAYYKYTCVYGTLLL